jgi:drug/metabolite transporter (DMT)-like permease
MKAFILSAIAILLWSTVASAFKLGLQHYKPFGLVLLASSTSLIVLMAFAIRKHRLNLFTSFSHYKHLLLSALQGLINPFLYYIVLFLAYDNLPAQIAQPVNFTWPFFLSLMAILFLKEPFSVKTFPALILSFFGVVIVSTQGNFTEGLLGVNKEGVALGLFSAVLWAIYWILGMKDKRPSLIKLSGSFFFGVFFLFLFGIVKGKLPVLVPGKELLLPVYIGLFEMSVTFVIWMLALEKASNTPLLSNLVYVVPVLSLFFIRWVLKEELQPPTFIGLGFIIAGVILQSLKRTKSLLKRTTGYG